MRLRSLGSTDLLVSPMGLGLAALGRPGYINLGHADDLERQYEVKSMEAHAHRILDAAYEGGIVYFDVARSYGRAEAFLASWLQSRAVSPSSVVVGSKWGYIYTADWEAEAEHHEVKEHSPNLLRRQWRESRATLGSHLDLYQIHSATLESGVLQNAAVIRELARLKEKGVGIGLTVSGPQQAKAIEQAIEVVLDGVNLFDSVQATWNLLERSAGPSLEKAHNAGLGVIVKEALANGRLTRRNKAPEFQGPLGRLRSEAERLGASIDALALAAVLAQPWADVVLSGAAREDQLHSNQKALEVDLDEGAFAGLEALVEAPDQYWKIRS
ncbi:MAG: aldo/keto reductase, partial [Anaerolineae bacterium]|nr:aldo/keto reductase [Anaerolineae bacterium]NIN98329.1 aldo/keto reductase [Anaerolineae bacterium]